MVKDISRLEVAQQSSSMACINCLLQKLEFVLFFSAISENTERISQSLLLL